MTKLMSSIILLSLAFLLGKLAAADECKTHGQFYAAGKYKCEAMK